jgi:hypothetical protein
VTEVTRSGTPVRTGRFMANRLVALVEHPAIEGDGSRVDVETRRRMGVDTERGRSRAGRGQAEGVRQLTVLGEDEPEPAEESPEDGA